MCPNLPSFSYWAVCFLYLMSNKPCDTHTHNISIVSFACFFSNKTTFFRPMHRCWKARRMATGSVMLPSRGAFVRVRCVQRTLYPRSRVCLELGDREAIEVKSTSSVSSSFQANKLLGLVFKIPRFTWCKSRFAPRHMGVIKIGIPPRQRPMGWVRFGK